MNAQQANVFPATGRGYQNKLGNVSSFICGYHRAGNAELDVSLFISLLKQVEFIMQ